MINKLMVKLYVKGYSFIKSNRKGQSLVEYGLILALVAVVSIAVLSGLSNKVGAVFNKIANALS